MRCGTGRRHPGRGEPQLGVIHQVAGDGEGGLVSWGSFRAGPAGACRGVVCIRRLAGGGAGRHRSERRRMPPEAQCQASGAGKFSRAKRSRRARKVSRRSRLILSGGMRSSGECKDSPAAGRSSCVLAGRGLERPTAPHSGPSRSSFVDARPPLLTSEALLLRKSVSHEPSGHRGDHRGQRRRPHRDRYGGRADFRPPRNQPGHPDRRSRSSVSSWTGRSRSSAPGR